MAYLPIARFLPQWADLNGDPASGFVLKAYLPGSSTPISFATDNTGAVMVSTIALDSLGYPEVSGNEVIPHIDQNFKLALFPTQAAADSNTGEVWIIDNIIAGVDDLGGSEILNIGDGTARTSGLNIGQVQDGVFKCLGATAGSADTYELTPSVPITAYAITQEFTVKIHASNLTTTPYLQLSGIADPATNAVIVKLDAVKAEIDLEVGDLLINGIYKIKRNSANDRWILLNPEKPFFDGINLTNNPPTGAIIHFAFDTPPDGWLECDGSTVSRTTFIALFTATGTRFGIGDGSTTFEIPDIRGEFIRGFDNGAGSDPDAGSRTDSGDGTTGDNVGTKQSNQTQSHKHGTPFNLGGSNLAWNSSPTYGTSASSFTRNTQVSIAGSSGSNNAMLTNSVLETLTEETRPRNVYMMYCIKF